MGQIAKYAYVMLKDQCAAAEDIVYMSNKKLPGHEVMILMLEHGSYGCEVYETRSSDDRKIWKNISTFGSIMSDLF